ncbi:response regulator transcription factor [Aquipuribacter sp. MA13-6]|uniref:response regulator transcription factor n=1 Tax=unclassified Aquipuribacter TaxID=2635084 RepID=UPI003EEAA8F2
MSTLVHERARIPLSRGRFHAAVVAGSPGLRESLVRVLTSLGAADVATAGLVEEARLLGRGTPTSLAVVECQLPDGSGIAAVETLRSMGWTRTVLLSQSTDPFTVRGALMAGARCFLVTNRPNAHSGPAGASDPGVDQLSAREIEVLALVADGRSNKEVGESLGLSALTVKSHLARIARKLGTGDRAEMVAMAMRAGAVA